MRGIAIAAAVLLASGCAQPPPPAAEVQPSQPPVEEPRAEHPDESGLPPLIRADVPAPAPAWSDEVDFLALREAYGARADFAERCEDRGVAQKAGAALLADRFSEVVDLTSPALARCPVWIQLHLWRTAALRQLHRDAEADQHKRWVTGLLDTILASGDGKSAETAYVTISTIEEYIVLSRLGLKPQQQSLTADPMRDRFDAVDESGHHVTVYFDPKWHFIRLMHQVTGT